MVGGITSAIVGGTQLHDDGNTDGQVAAYIAAVVAGAITAAGILAAAGYVVTLLVDIFEQVWETRYAVQGDDEDETRG